MYAASKPFQFSDRIRLSQSHTVDNSMSAKLLQTSLGNKLTTPFSSFTSVTDSKAEIVQLKKENQLLRDTLKVVVGNVRSQTHESETQHLKHLIYQLQNGLFQQQKAISDLKLQIKRLNSERSRTSPNKSHLDYVQDNEFCLDLGELQSMPPFPFAK